MERHSQHLYEFGPFQLDPVERRLLRNGERVALTPKVFETLVALLEHRGRLIEKNQLMKLVWPDSFVEEANLTNNVSTLRKVLGEGESGQSYIETLPRIGYRFTAQVTEVPRLVTEIVVERHSLTRIETEEAEEDSANATVAQSPAGSSAGAAHARPSLRLRYLVSGALIVAALVVIGTATAFGIYWLSTRSPTRNRATAAAFSLIDISRLTSSGKTTHAAISADGRYIAHITVDADGDSLWVRHVAAPTSVRIAGPSPSEFVSVKFAPDGASIFYVALDRDKGDTTLYRVPVLGGPSTMAAYDAQPIDFSPDGSQLTFIRSDKSVTRLVVANADGTNERTLATRQQPEFFRVDWNAPAWSPDGKTIACQVRLKDERGRYDTVVGVKVAGGSQTPLTSERWNYVGQPVWLGDGSGLLVTGSESEAGPAQIWHIALKSGKATRITHDLNDYYDLSLTADSSRLVAVQKNSVSSIWVAPEGDTDRAKQISSEVGTIRELAWMPDGRIVYRSNAGGSAEIWVMNSDGSNPKQLTAGARASRGLTASPDGRYIFFVSERDGRFNVWRVDAGGSNLTQMTKGDDDFYPNCSPDGQWVVFQREVLEPRLWKFPVNGGDAVQLTTTRAVWPHVSPDSQMIAYYYLDPDVEKSHWRIGIVSAEGGRPLNQFDFPMTVAPAGRFVRWSPDGQSIAFVNNPGGLSDVWLQPLNGSQPKQFTNFKAEQIIAFDWARDGRSLAVVRGVQTSDVVLIEQNQR